MVGYVWCIVRVCWVFLRVLGVGSRPGCRFFGFLFDLWACILCKSSGETRCLKIRSVIGITSVSDATLEHGVLSAGLFVSTSMSLFMKPYERLPATSGPSYFGLFYFLLSPSEHFQSNPSAGARVGGVWVGGLSSIMFPMIPTCMGSKNLIICREKAHGYKP